MPAPFSVEFMVVGAQKCGTTTLYRLLDAHPRVVGCRTKEPHFFSKDPDWRAHLDEYASLYPAAEGRLRFEASTTYTFFPGTRPVWDDLHEFNPDLRVVYLVRDPVQRLVSAYMHSYERGRTDEAFEDAVFRKANFLDVTRYATQITPFIDRFSRELVHICFFEDLVRAPGELLAGLGAFLELDPSGFGDPAALRSNTSVGGASKRHVRHDNPGLALRAVRRLAPPLYRRITDNSARAFAAKPEVSAELRRAIAHVLRHEITEVEALTGRDLSAWRA